MPNENDASHLTGCGGAGPVDARCREMLESMPDAIVIVNGAGAIALVNSRAEAVFGYTRAELLGRPLEILLPERHRRSHGEHLAGYFAQPRARPMGAGLDLRGLRKNGEEFPADISLSPIQTEEGLMVMSAIRDVTDRKRIEQALQEKKIELEKASELERLNAELELRALELNRARERAEAGTRAKNEFLANMSHEIRTPMNGLIGMLDLMLAEEPPGGRRESLTVARSSAQSLLHLLTEILAFARIEAGKLECRNYAFSIAECMNAAMDEFAFQAAGKGLDLSCERAADIPQILLGDPVRVQHILTNLIANAIKFTEHGGIAVRAAIDSVAPGEIWVHFTVTDTGIGIAAGEREHIFEAFTQVDASTTRSHGGAGIGLAIARKLVELLGGRIWVESEPGRGSAFHFTVRFGLGEAA